MCYLAPPLHSPTMDGGPHEPARKRTEVRAAVSGSHGPAHYSERSEGTPFRIASSSLCAPRAWRYARHGWFRDSDEDGQDPSADCRSEWTDPVVTSDEAACI